MFMVLALVVFNLVPRGFRKYALILFSVAFIYLEGGVAGLLTLAAITVITWGIGVLFFGPSSEPGKNDSGYGREGSDVAASEKKRSFSPSDAAFTGNKKRYASQRAVAFIGIAGLALFLFAWKYLPWAALQMVGDISEVLPEDMDIMQKTATAAIPIGLSFYTFQAISYVADLYTGKIAAERNFFKYALYMMWFPKWMSGPIERAGDFIGQLDNCEKTKPFEFDRAIRAITYLIWGMFMKFVIADHIGVIVDTVFADIASYGPVALILTSLLYTMQIYCDFAGYTNSMIGISGMFGLDLTQNFKVPYLAESTVEFWRKWHISLSNFLRDYVYIPLGGNRKGEGRKILNNMIVFLICGMWHGAGLSFIVWGLLHGVFNTLSNIVKKSKASFLVRGNLGRFITFCLVSFAWIFFRAPSIAVAGSFVGGMIPGVNPQPFMAGFDVVDKVMMGASTFDWGIIVVSLLVLTVMDVIANREKTIPPEIIIGRWGDFSRGIALAVIFLVVMIFGMYGAGDDIRSFVYMQF